MKNFYLIILLILFGLDSLAQDTCAYISQNNLIGGLDCTVISVAPYTADSYQWLNCDSSFIEITGQTSGGYSGPTGINVALEITYLGCVDTSYCNPTCTIGINELKNKQKKLLKIVNYMGIESEDKPNTMLIYLYNDGTKKKILRIE